MNKLKNIFIVLVNPTFPKNVGLVCRTMKNFGAGELILVSPTHDVKELGMVTATHSDDILRDALVVSTLQEALAGQNEAWGFTVRTGKLRRDLVPLPELKEFSSQKKIALVFGPERTGLHNDDLSLCSKLVTIPTEDELQSLNVSHAVSIALYHLFMSGEKVETQEKEFADMNLRHQFSEQLTSIMLAVEKGKTPEDSTLIRLRALVNSIELTEEDLNILLSVTGKTKGALKVR